MLLGPSVMTWTYSCCWCTEHGTVLLLAFDRGVLYDTLQVMQPVACCSVQHHQFSVTIVQKPDDVSHQNKPPRAVHIGIIRVLLSDRTDLLFFSTGLSSKTSPLMSPFRNNTNASVTTYNTTIVYTIYTIFDKYIGLMQQLTAKVEGKNKRSLRPTAM